MALFDTSLGKRSALRSTTTGFPRLRRRPVPLPKQALERPLLPRRCRLKIRRRKNWTARYTEEYGDVDRVYWKVYKWRTMAHSMRATVWPQLTTRKRAVGAVARGCAGLGQGGSSRRLRRCRNNAPNNAINTVKHDAIHWAIYSSNITVALSFTYLVCIQKNKFSYTFQGFLRQGDTATRTSDTSPSRFTRRWARRRSRWAVPVPRRACFPSAGAWPPRGCPAPAWKSEYRTPRPSGRKASSRRARSSHLESC